MLKDLIPQDDFDQPEGCLLVGADIGGAQGVSPFLVGQSALPVPVSTFRVKQCSTGIHKNPETGHGALEAERDTVGGVHRRPLVDGIVPRGAD